MPFNLSTACPIEADQVAVAISRGDFGTHIGLVFKDAKKVPRILHLAWHKRLAVDDYPEPTPAKCWIAFVPDIPLLTARAFIGVLRKVAKRQPHVPYGINVLAAFGSFSVDGDYRAPKGSDGLTCATFVSELFKAVAMPLVVETSWPEGVNVEWANGICDLLLKTGADAVHVEAVRANASGRRLQPHELGVASTAPYATWPLDYGFASSNSQVLLDCLNTCCTTMASGEKLH